MTQPAARPRSERPFLHPLSGADLATFVRVLAAGGWPQAGVRARTLCAFLAVVGRTPFDWIERPIASLRARSLPAQAPIFLLGHWRSGTTHLYNVMSKGNFAFVDPLAAGLPWNIQGLVRWLRPLLERALPTERFVDALAVEPDSPQEDELALACMTPDSYYHGVYFPQAFEQLFERGLFQTGMDAEALQDWSERLKYLYGKLRLAQPGKQLLIKNPAHTHRIEQLSQLFPNAKFVHIVRNPYEVFASTRAFYHSLFAALALQSYQHLDIEKLTLETYPRLMRPLIEQSAALSADRFIELRYEEMEQAPLSCLERIYAQLALPDFAKAKPTFESYLAKVGGYQARHKQFNDRDLVLVERHWQPFLDHWGYRRPKQTALG